MPIKGITEDDEIIIKTIIEPYKKDYDFFFYGSRVKGNFRFLSDLDIMIKGVNGVNVTNLATTATINDLKEKFDKSNLSYVVNISDYNSLDENFYKLIEQDLVKIE